MYSISENNKKKKWMIELILFVSVPYSNWSHIKFDDHLKRPKLTQQSSKSSNHLSQFWFENKYKKKNWCAFYFLLLWYCCCMLFFIILSLNKFFFFSYFFFYYYFANKIFLLFACIHHFLFLEQFFFFLFCLCIYIFYVARLSSRRSRNYSKTAATPVKHQ